MNEAAATDAPLVAIVGMAGRFPGARNVDEFWRNLRDGVESITPLSEQELRGAGVSQAELANPNYVRAAAILEDFDRFDAAFFGLSPKDAAIMDPQHRLFLEAAWEALENAGWCPDEFDGRIGVYAGSGMNSYLIHNLLTNPRLVAETGLFLLKQTGNDKDVLATRVSYQLNLTGPSLAVQTACSTSLVAIHLATQSLLNHECDLALAGGVTIEVPHGRGYIYREREILARDGHCRAFDAASSGTVFGSGLGLVVLRRLADARRDGDHIRAVIRGTAINNDGARKVGYFAPSVAGQAEAVAEALAVADVPAESISYIEAHGTGTAVGDPIELTALTQVFRATTTAQGFCAVGSVKTNIGHLDAAAGVTGVIKTVLALEHRQLPASLNFTRPNPLIDFTNSPFYVNTQLRDWLPAAPTPRRAGVTALGIGGTNAHIILEEAPPAAPATTSRPWQLLTLAAKTPSALEALGKRLADHLSASEVDLADTAYTLHRGRKAFPLRRALVCRTAADAAQALDRLAPDLISGRAREVPPPLLFLFPGQGSQYVAMGQQLYQHEPEFRAVVDTCAALLQPLLDLDLRTILFPSADRQAEAARLLDATRLTQPALFVIEYAMAKLLAAWGIQPTAMIGHSVGEFTAACLAEVITLPAALRIVAERGRLMQSPPPGAMVAVPLPVAKVEPLLGPQLSIASINADDQCVVAGPLDAITTFETALGAGVATRRLRVSHAFHSGMMEEILPAFSSFLRQFTFAPPRIPFMSSATGRWFTAAEAGDPDYWCRQLRQTVRFRDGAVELLKQADAIFLEVGPGNTLGTLLMRQRNYAAEQEVIATMRPRQADDDDGAVALRCLGQLWTAGCKVNWPRFHAHETRRSVVLPSYPFERQRFWIEPGDGPVAPTAEPRDDEPATAQELFHAVWRRADPEPAAPREAGAWLILRDAQGLGTRLGELLRSRGARCYEVAPGPDYARLDEWHFQIDPARRADYAKLCAALGSAPAFPDTIVHLWSVVAPAPDLGSDPAPATATLSFYSLLYLSQALGAADVRGALRLAIVSNNLEQLPGETSLMPERALLAGPCGVIPKELPNVECRHIDLKLPAPAVLRNGAGATALGELALTLLHELRSSSTATPVVYRDQRRWVRSFAPLAPPTAGGAPLPLRERGVYLITGGLGGLGLTLARSLARTVHARLVLLGRTALPPRETWDERLGAAAAAATSDPLIAKLRQIRDLERDGAEVLTLAANVTDLAAMRDAIAQAHAAFGGLDGVIHAAGILDDAPLLQKDSAAAARVLAPKLAGTLTLETALAAEKLDFLILMSSVSAILGPAGQFDYAAANAFLDAFARSRTGQRGYPVLAIQWPRWREVGLAADAAIGSSPHPLLGAPRLVDNAPTVYSTILNTDRDWIVAEHRLQNGPALFPGCGYIEMMHGALTARGPDRTVTIKNLYFTAPVAVRAQASQVLRLTMRKDGGAYRFAAATARQGDSGEWLDCAEGEAFLSPPTAPRSLDLAAIRDRCTQQRRSFAPTFQNPLQERFIAFGPRWRSLQEIDLGHDEALVVVELPPQFHDDLRGYRLHPALLDMATGAAMMLIPGYDAIGHLYVPASYGSITLYANLPARCYSHIRFRRAASADSSLAAFDITITDEAGRIVIEIEDFLLREVRDPALLATGRLDRNAPPRPRRPQPAAAPAIVDAIGNDEGIAAFHRILAAPEPNIVVFPSDFAAAVQQAAPVRATAPRGPAGAPAAVATDAVEATLLAWWRDLLGADEAGLDDDFFALGGQSLTAVRLLARIKKTYGVELDLAVLFKAPTIAQLARLVRRDDTPANYRSIVPIRTGDATPPLFLVHALGGRVIGYGDLARRLPAAQAVYGVEFALPDANPAHFRMEHLAAFYLGELRRVQPEGPYHLLGFSFGGLMAYEMAQQLCAAGQQVAFLGMLDTWQTGHIRDLERKMNSPHRAFQRALLLLRHARDEVVRADSASSIMRKLSRRGRQFLTDLIGTGRRISYMLLERLQRPVPRLLQFSNDINWYAVHKYSFKPYPGRITLFRASAGMGASDDRYGWDLGWGGLAQGGVAVHEVTSDHLGILREPSVGELAREIAACLDQCCAPKPAAKLDQLTSARPVADYSAVSK